MTIHITGTREEWLAARLDLLRAEKEHTRKGDELAQRRQDPDADGQTGRRPQYDMNAYAIHEGQRCAN